MAEYQCIGCGATTESEMPCTCSVCGYTMYPLPFQRGEKLRSEIRRFVDCVIHEECSCSDLIFAGLEQDQNRFPDFGKIQSYVCASQKTEIFSERIGNTLEQLRKYFTTPFRKKYNANLSGLSNRIGARDGQLKEIMETLQCSCMFHEIAFPEIRFCYEELPNPQLLPSAEVLLEKLGQLAEKIYLFIRKNNLYGIAFDKRLGRFKLEDEDGAIDWQLHFQQCETTVEDTLSKPYKIDIFDSGEKELHEMLKALWNGVFLLLSAPILQRTSWYTYGTETHLSEAELLYRLNMLCSMRYAAIEESAASAEFLSDRSENRLFDLYNEMLELDENGYLKASKGKLLPVGQSEQRLNALIGLSNIKTSIQKIKAYALANKHSDALNLHMCFYGNPGTGKTEVARIIADILFENGLLPTNKVVETDRSGLVAGYVGQTALKTMEVISEAMGGVLFIDEAYALIPKDRESDYGHEAVATLIKAMEDHRGKFCVILAGYKNPMEEMLSSNPGFRSRIQFFLDFPNYDRGDLRKITGLMLRKRQYMISEQALEKLLDITDVKRKEPNFANAREIRNLLDQVIMCQNLRCVGTEEKEIALVDVNTYIKEANLSLPTSGDSFSKNILTAEEELERLVGLAMVKRTIKKIKAFAKRNKNDAELNLHMAFCGNPGTGKTEVARILSRILYEAGVLPEAKLTETDAHGLIGKYVGETAPKTQAKINDAMGGVLFIDEAYALADTSGADGVSSGYGDEAISVLLKEMEDKRGRFCVILAGYKAEMSALLGRNPGLASRIQFSLDFADYSREELREIALAFLTRKHYCIDSNAMELVLDITEYYRNQPNFANARTIRNVLDQVIMNQNLRTEDEEEPDEQIMRCDVEDYLTDEGIDLNAANPKPRKIGFC